MKIIPEGKFRAAMAVITAGTQTWLTIFVTTIYNIILGWGVVTANLTFKDYIFAVGPINTMVMAFWLGSETALRQPSQPRPDTVSEPEEPK
jgi:hypothetical protein